MSAEIKKRLNQLRLLLNKQIDADESFEAELSGIILGKPAAAKPARKPAAKSVSAGPAVDPLAGYRSSPEALKSTLEALTVPELHVIIKEFALDAGGASKRWKSAAKLVEFIMAMAESRTAASRLY